MAVSKKTVAVAGASGYAGGELLRLLSKHPGFEVRTVTGHSSAGDLLGTHQPHLRALANLQIQETKKETLQGHDVIFFALPHGASGRITAQLETTDSVLIDCGADRRLERAADWRAYYGGGFHESWAYGVPELEIAERYGGGKQREVLRDAQRIAAPGCNASTVALSLVPAVKAGIIDTSDIVTTLAVGPSGAGKAAKTHLLAAELLGSATPYAVGGQHRHIPEVLQALYRASEEELDLKSTSGYSQLDAKLTFTPALVPMARGILAVTTARLKPGIDQETVRKTWVESYADEPFVHVLEQGQQPRTKDVIGANTCLMSVNIDERSSRVIVAAVVDNLVKGTAGAAIQCANIAVGYTETLGLEIDGVAP